MVRTVQIVMPARTPVPSGSSGPRRSGTWWGRRRSRVVDPDSMGRRMFLQKVPEGKTLKNRLHLDVRSSDQADDDEARDSALLMAEVERLLPSSSSSHGQMPPSRRVRARRGSRVIYSGGTTCRWRRTPWLRCRPP